METLQTIHGVAPVRRRGKLVSVALVGSLHLAVIYTLLVALEIVPNPVAPPPPIIHVTVFDHIKVIPLPQMPDSGVALTHPRTPFNATPPPINIQNLPTGPGVIAPNPSSGPISPVGPTAGPTLPVRALASTHTIPPYPPMAMRFGYEGTVRLRIAVDEQGNVFSADVLNSSGHTDLDDAAVSWVKSHWRYQPAVQNGNAVPATTNAVVTFRLNQLHG
ncbi:MAG TPA: energy transducer TonB [Rhizomicrobium sp.]|jgi:protein TonB|nr:energy transducer TonB [Rhizomicrobium sp.]